MPCRQVCRRRQARPERQHPIGFQLGLAALVASGHGDVPLFKLRCAARAGHPVVVSGQSYDDPYRGCDLGNDPSCDGSTTIRSASAIASSRLVRGALRDDGRRGVVPQSAPRLPVCRRCNNRRRIPHGDRRQRSTLTVASLPSLGTSGRRSSTEPRRPVPAPRLPGRMIRGEPARSARQCGFESSRARTSPTTATFHVGRLSCRVNCAGSIAPSRRDATVSRAVARGLLSP